MGCHIFFTHKISLHLVIKSTIFALLTRSILSIDQNYVACASKNCGSGPNISYPFWIPGKVPALCGRDGFRVTCEDDKPVYDTSEGRYVIQHISYETNVVRLVDIRVALERTCPVPGRNFSFESKSLSFLPSHADLMFLFNCSEQVPKNYTQVSVPCNSNSSFVSLIPPEMDWPRGVPCEGAVFEPVDLEGEELNESLSKLDYTRLLRNGFALEWSGPNCEECAGSGGYCGYNEQGFVCFCADGPHLKHCNLDGVHQFSPKGKIVVIIASTIGLLLFCLGLVLFYWKKRRLSNRTGVLRCSSKHNLTYENQKEDLQLRLFDRDALVHATDNFSSNNILGVGGFGTVYKGALAGGQEIAVKRLSASSSQGLEEFKNEVTFIAKLQHRNLVKLLGWCIEREEKMLIYEYMPNKSLDFYIFDQAHRSLLDWPKCFNIINGISRGILYLHQDSRLRIIHRDLKASNVLLDIDMNPKIADFGMARSFGGNETEANTRRIVGTYGYISPEYQVDGIFSMKSDVFSFGVLVLEIVAGKKNRGFLHPDHNHNLLGHAWKLHNEGRSLDLIDASETNSSYIPEVLRSIHVALLCVQQTPEDRPSMSSVVLMLSSDIVLPQPKQPGFFTERTPLEAKCSATRDAPCSDNEVTISLLDAR